MVSRLNSLGANLDYFLKTLNLHVLFFTLILKCLSLFFGIDKLKMPLVPLRHRFLQRVGGGEPCDVPVVVNECKACTDMCARIWQCKNVMVKLEKFGITDIKLWSKGN
jgi:hypothetical protein